jgi:Pyruvate/2-oxoacid:ferredoxin oxidoreductase delta subunit
LGVVFVSADPVALDVIACKLIGLDPAYVPTIAAAEKIGLGCADTGRIRLVGDAIEPLIDRSFDVVRMPPVALPQTTALGAMKRMFLPRPVISKRKCTRCGQCISICPLTLPALSQKVKKRPPVYDYNICIRCYCCQEACPSEAISIKTPFIRKLLPAAAYLLRSYR